MGPPPPPTQNKHKNQQQSGEKQTSGVCLKSSRSVHVVKVIWDAEGFINTAVVEGELLLCPGLDGKHVVWKQKCTAAM